MKIPATELSEKMATVTVDDISPSQLFSLIAHCCLRDIAIRVAQKKNVDSNMQPLLNDPICRNNFPRHFGSTKRVKASSEVVNPLLVEEEDPIEDDLDDGWVSIDPVRVSAINCAEACKLLERSLEKVRRGGMDEEDRAWEIFRLKQIVDGMQMKDQEIYCCFAMGG